MSDGAAPSERRSCNQLEGEAPMSMQERETGGPAYGGFESFNPLCPGCAGRMLLKQVTPALFASKVDEMIFGCDNCGTEIERTVSRA
jgi:hypothetical protein